MPLRLLSWNLFHGRDHPPNPALHTWRSRLLRITERDRSHAQVNVDLFGAFASRLAAAPWEVALLQECPPRWWRQLAGACEAEAHGVLTARNPPLLGELLSAAARLNPDLIASWEGGSNLTLVRGGHRIAERANARLASHPERRAMALTRLECGIAVANFHLSERRQAAELELAEAARIAGRFRCGDALVLGGDFNLRPARSPAAFALLAAEHGLSGTTDPTAIDHLLVAGAPADDPRAPGPEWRETADPTAPPGNDDRPIRLSDHAPVMREVSLDAD